MSQGGQTCKICGATETWFAAATILRKYEVAYFRCQGCGFIRTEDPYWLKEAYADPIVFSDVGLVERNLQFARMSRTIIQLFFNSRGRFLDYGGGYGLFVRLMRDRGFDFYRFDPCSVNLFARGFDGGTREPHPHELLTAFEVFEHLTDPVAEVQKMLAFAPSILFSTQLLPEPAPLPGQWWYYALEGGQHIALYTRRTLQCLADRWGLHLASWKEHLHLLTPNKRAARWFKYACHRRSARLADCFLRKQRSLLDQDYQQLTGQSLR